VVNEVPPSVEILNPPAAEYVRMVAAYTVDPSAEAYTPCTLLLPRPLLPLVWLVKVFPPSVEMDNPPSRPLKRSSLVAAYTVAPSAEAYTWLTTLLGRPVVWLVKLVPPLVEIDTPP
jgi:hypothetical protein